MCRDACKVILNDHWDDGCVSKARGKMHADHRSDLDSLLQLLRPHSVQKMLMKVGIDHFGVQVREANVLEENQQHTFQALVMAPPPRCWCCPCSPGDC